jgi:hypothetical protein
MRLSSAALLAAALLSGCTRDLAVPPANRLAFDQPFRTAAPRQLLTDLRVSGGSGGYVFAFAQGGQLSGADATVDSATGAYRAGGRGSAQDLVQVTDGSGATAVVRISVGAPLSVAPPIGGTAPGGALAFTVSGGLPPYGAALAPGGSGAGRGVAHSGGVLTYVAGASGPAVDDVVVTDATHDPAAIVTVAVRVTISLGAFASALTVAPYDSATVVGTGGQPQYAYDLALDASGGATVTQTGYYTAGGTGGVTDRIRVTDQNGEAVLFDMHVGPALALKLDGAPPDPRPGAPSALVASGGKPPYAYRYARGGNRSGGTVDGTTGVYVPGPASGAVDLFEVTDQTARARARISNPTPVGATQLPTGSGNRVCASGDLDGDGIDDVLVANDYFERMVTELRIASGQPRLDAYTVASAGTDSGTDFLVVEDLDGDGRADVLLRTARGDVLYYKPDLLGQLTLNYVYGGTAYPWFKPGLIVPVRDRPNGLRFITSMSGSPNCGASGAVGMQFLAGAIGLYGPGVVQATCPTPTTGYPSNIIGLAAGDLDGDGYADLAILESQAGGASDGKLYVAYGNASGGFDAVNLATTAALFPAGYSWPAWSDQGAPYVRFEPVVAETTAVPARAGGLLVRVQDASGRGEFVTARVTKNRAWTFNGPYDLEPTWPGPSGFVPVPRSSLAGAERLYVGYNVTDGHLLGVALDADLIPTEVAVQPAPRASRIDCVTFPDLNADGAPDLVAVGQFVATSDLLLGASASTVPTPSATPRFGDRVHRRGLGFPTIAADLDGDGLTDVVSWDGTGLDVLVGGGGQLGNLQRLSNVLTMGVAAGPLFEPSVLGTAIVFHDQATTFYAALPDGAGGFQAPYALGVAQSGGGTFSDPVYALYPVDLGTPALYTGGAVFLVQGPHDLLAVPMKPVPDVDHPEKCSYVPAPYVRGATSAAFLAGCTVPQTPPNGAASDFVVYVSTLSGLGTAAPAFGAWSRKDHWLGANPNVDLTVINALVGTTRPLDGRPFFVYWDPTLSSLQIVTFDAAMTASNQPLARAGDRVSKAMGSSAMSLSLVAGAPDDLLVRTDTAFLLLRRSSPGGTFTKVQELRGGMQAPVGAGRLDPAAPPFVITAGAGMFAGAGGTEIVPIPTSGGFLR